MEFPIVISVDVFGLLYNLLILQINLLLADKNIMTYFFRLKGHSRWKNLNFVQVHIGENMTSKCSIKSCSRINLTSVLISVPTDGRTRNREALGLIATAGTIWIYSLKRCIFATSNFEIEL